MAEYDRYINLPGFDNVNRALTLLNVPKDIVGNLGDASVDAIANPDNLPMRERIGRGIEAGIGTLAYGLGPLLARFGGQKAAQAIPETLMGFSGPQAADEVVKDVVQDPSRRKFLAGAAATVPVAALAPDVITDVATQVAKRGPGAPRTSIFTSAAANIRELKRQIEDLQQIKDDIDFRDNPNETPALTKELDEQYVQASRDQDANEQILKDEYSEVFEMLNDDPVLIKNAPDDDLEFVLENVYEDNVDIYDVVKNLNLENDMSDVIANEIKTRKLHLQKDKNGIDKYPYARLFLEDYQEINLGPISMPYPSMQMVRETPDFVTDYLNENANKIINEDIENIILDGRIDKKSTEEINKKILEYAETNRIAAPRRAFDNPKVEYISTKEIADNIAQFNFPRYDVGKFGGDLKSGNINESPVFQERFDKSGQPTLKEDIFNEGIKEPIEIELALSNGEIIIGEGHHRLQAAIELNLPEVPVIVKTIDYPRYPYVVRPGRLDTSGLELDKDYSYSDLNFSDRLIEPRETPEELFRRGGSYFLNPKTNEISDRRFPDKYTPMRKGFFRRTDKKAMGGPIKGIASLNDVARDMYRGPRGIDAYQQFTSGGYV